MNDKEKSYHKNSAGSNGARSDARRSSTDVPSGWSELIEARFRAVFESSRDAIGVSKAGMHVFVNPAYLELFGFPPGTDLAGKPVLDLIQPDCRDHIKKNILRRARGETVPSTYSTCGMRTDGSTFDMAVNVFSYQENGEDHTLVILRDITERKRSDDALKESEERYRLLTEMSPNMIAIHQEGRFVFINEAGLRMLGAHGPEELIGKLILDVVHPDYRDIVRERVKRGIEEGMKASVIEEVFVRIDGTEVPVEVTGLPFMYKGGPAMIVIAREITESSKPNWP